MLEATVAAPPVRDALLHEILAAPLIPTAAERAAPGDTETPAQLEVF